MFLTFLCSAALSVGLFPAVVRAPLPHSDTPALQYEWYHSLAYPLLSALALAAVISEGWVGPRDLVHTAFGLHAAWAQLGFFAGGLVLAATSSFPRLPESLIHHSVTLVTFGGLLLLDAFPSVLLWVFVIQTTGVVFHPWRLLRRSERGRPRALAALEWTHLGLFVALRLVGYTVATCVFLWRDHEDPLFDGWVWRVLKYGIVVIYAALHVSWGAALVRGIRRR
ncbi:MAG: TLC domain-containing protein [Sandaracinaceae bacterium]